MSKAGWYPDPGGAPNQFRYWDGQQWGQELSPNPAGANPARASDPSQPLGGYQQYASYQQNQYQPSGYATQNPTAKKTGGIFVLLAAGVLVLALIVAGVMFLPKLIDGGGGGGGSSNPTTNPCPKRIISKETPRSPYTADGRVLGGKLSYPKLMGEWGLPQVEDRVPFGRDAFSQTVLLHRDYSKKGDQWVASVLVAELVSGDGFYGPKEGAELIARCAMGEFYGDAKLTRDDKTSKVMTMSGKEAWLLETHLSFTIKGLNETGETAIFVVVRTSEEGASLYYASIPDSRPDLLETARITIDHLRVEA